MLGLYIHVPFCKSKCAYCDFCSFQAEDGVRERYVQALIREIHLASEATEDRVVDTVFIGGGTPTLLYPEQLRRILEAVEAGFVLMETVEISVESNPATLTDSHLSLFKEKRVSRISIGLQAAQNTLLKRLGRAHTWEQFLETYQRVRQAGRWAINVDLIYHLPGQTRRDWNQTLERVIALNPEHISCYSLQLEEGTPLEQAVTAGRYHMSSDGNDRWMHHRAIDQLTEAGYLHYEISNFSKPGHECRHNMRYWQRSPYLGLGLAAHGFDGSRRYANPESLDIYLETLERGERPSTVIEDLKPEEALFETVMLGLRLSVGIDWSEIMALCPLEKQGSFTDALRTLTAQGLLLERDNRIQLTRQGMDLSNRVFSVFMEL